MKEVVALKEEEVSKRWYNWSTKKWEGGKLKVKLLPPNPFIVPFVDQVRVTELGSFTSQSVYTIG